MIVPQLNYFMTKKQTQFILIFIGIFLLSTTYFREGWFVQNNISICMYRLFAAGGLVLMAGSIGSYLGKKGMWLAVSFLFILEISFAVLFGLVKNGKELPGNVTAFLGYIYLFHCRDYIVYDEERGRYDEDLFYTLKPGDFEYNNMEFSTRYHINSAGFRDNENSLDFPEIIFLGDSYTMGWGVEQDESFAAILENKMNRKSLNLGVASFGTAREYLAFEKIKHDSCQLLILQFCPNDKTENNSFVKNNFELNVSPKEKFEKEIIWNKLYQVYFPLKYVHSTIHFFADKITTVPCQSELNRPLIIGGISETALSDFFLILNKIKKSFNGKIIVFNLGMNITTPVVNEQFNKWLGNNPLEDVYVFPSTDYLLKEDYLPLDTHLKKSGNQKLADGLMDFILKNNLIK